MADCLNTALGSPAVTVLVDVSAEFEKLTMFRNRTPASTRADRAGSSTQLAKYRDATIFANKSQGKGAWERHPAGDELVYILDGAATLEVISEGVSKSIPVSKGKLAIVSAGEWHRFHYPDGVTLLTITPGKSEYVRLDVSDPHSVEPERD